MRRHYFDSAIYCRAFDPVLSLESLSHVQDEDSGYPPFDFSDPASDPSEDLHELQVRAAAAQFIASLTEPQALVARRLYWDGCTQAEIARELGVSRMAVSKTVRKIHDAGRLQLADCREFIN